jgi:anti-anti-sigma regulatory factor
MTDLESYRQYVDERLEELMDIVLNIAMGDLSRRPVLRDEQDSLNLLAAGLEMMIDDLIEANRQNEEKTQALEGAKANLERQVAARTQELRQRLAELEAANEAQRRLLETVRQLSTPVVPIYSGILILPLVSQLDTHRAQQIMEKSLGAIQDYEAEVLIIDITGVPTVDTRVAQYLLQVASAAGLLGSRVILTGIRPEVAQTMVQFEIDISKLITLGNLQSGIEYALRTMGLTIRES